MRGNSNYNGKRTWSNRWALSSYYSLPNFKGRYFKNLVIIEDDIHKLIHMTAPEKILKMLSLLRLSKRELTKMNKLRIQAGTTVIKVQKLDQVSKLTIL
ncbi:hypothetical protein D0437_30540 [Bacillus cereus]|uniref:Uncharacterized protein n=1 Tax=Bacillus cereus TaxID=1396 RepID=A0A9X7M1K7_BACCE|nr:hypothetical protein D0437_30540 [Bacillus cereus]